MDRLVMNTCPWIGAQVYQFWDGSWRAKCYDHEGHTQFDDGYWTGPARPLTDWGKQAAFNDRDKHNRTEHPDAI